MSGEVFNKFNNTALDLILRKHDFQNHTFKFYLTNTPPDAVAMKNKADLPGIAEGNGYTQADLVATIGSITLDGDEAVVTASGDHTITAASSTNLIPPFRYVVLYNDSDPQDALIGYWDYGFVVELKKQYERFNVGFETGELLRLRIDPLVLVE